MYRLTTQVPGQQNEANQEALSYRATNLLDSLLSQDTSFVSAPSDPD